MKVYLAGALFNEAEVERRLKEGKLLREAFSDIELFNPIEQPFNEDKQTLPTPETIYTNDKNAVFNSDVCIFDVTNEDAGVMVELGLAIAYGKKIIAVNSDIRLKSANKYEIPSYSMNHFVLGAILKHGVLVYSFDEVIKELKKY
ncbi:nucleoside 2-deoxyribosyltransferase [Oceanivirga miroungae]|uniref:2'-deoxynucleoside 5'-phosphate N-hydrolase 1 n=1 Tax=Oceanivirga miroungae TaxID=1130046 RepID=A0A6I8MBL6_9FUSO|nr:nucleoside 2-deoxyribosyltransferase [Oceanivirga miroungae]VWL85591.1 2'-deoxynucleoside 5'-phosphate N-hydrolase 1 [Oceanivirga miroungae]